MARSCAICEKDKMAANKVSHSNIKTKTRKLANLQRVRVVVDGSSRRILVCTRCIRTGLLKKRVRPSAEAR